MINEDRTVWNLQTNSRRCYILSKAIYCVPEILSINSNYIVSFVPIYFVISETVISPYDSISFAIINHFVQQQLNTVELE